MMRGMNNVLRPIRRRGTVMRAALAAALCAAAATAAAFDLQAHRGGRGLRPESTLAAFDNALRIGVTTLETDVAITADGVPVLSHDPALNPAITRDAQGRWLTAKGPLIRTLTLAQLQTFDVGRIDPASGYARAFPDQQPRDGERIPTLAALFERVKALGADAVQFDIETKIDPREPEATLAPEPFVRALLEVVRAQGMTARVMIQSFDWRTLELLHRLEPGMRTVYLSAEAPNFDTVRDGRWTAGRRLDDFGGSVPRMVRASAGTAPGVIWSPAWQTLTPARLAEAKALGLAVIPWTVNDPLTMQRLIEWGVDGLITDYPDRLREVMARWAMPLPAPVAR